MGVDLVLDLEEPRDLDLRQHLAELGQVGLLELELVALDRNDLVDHGLGLLGRRGLVDLGVVLDELLHAVADLGHLGPVLPVDGPERLPLGVGQPQVGGDERLAVGLDVGPQLLQLVGFADLGLRQRSIGQQGEGESQPNNEHDGPHVSIPPGDMVQRPSAGGPVCGSMSPAARRGRREGG